MIPPIKGVIVPIQPSIEELIPFTFPLSCKSNTLKSIGLPTVIISVAPIPIKQRKINSSKKESAIPQSAELKAKITVPVK